jgi:hypothetical protein
LIGTVLNNDKESQVLAQIFNCLSFTSTGWTLGGTTKAIEQSVGQGHVGAISQFGTNQAAIVALVLATVLETIIQLLGFDFHLSGRRFGVIANAIKA